MLCCALPWCDPTLDVSSNPQAGTTTSLYPGQCRPVLPTDQTVNPGIITPPNVTGTFVRMAGKNAGYFFVGNDSEIHLDSHYSVALPTTAFITCLYIT